MQRWEQRISARYLRLADRFVNFDLHIILHLLIKDTGQNVGRLS